MKNETPVVITTYRTSPMAIAACVPMSLYSSLHSPHPSYGHSLPFRRGEGRGEGQNVSLRTRLGITRTGCPWRGPAASTYRHDALQTGRRDAACRYVEGAGPRH